MLIDPTDYSMLTFGTGWIGDEDDSMKTDVPHSTATMKFNGTSLHWPTQCLDSL